MWELLRTIALIELFLVGGIAGYNLALLKIGLRSFDGEFEEEITDGQDRDKGGRP